MKCKLINVLNLSKNITYKIVITLLPFKANYIFKPIIRLVTNLIIFY